MASRVLLVVSVVLAVAAGWLAFGLLEAREDLRVGAAAVQAELVRAEAALGRGDTVAAGAAVQAAGRNLDFVEAVEGRRELRVAARLPLLSGGVGDLRRLLAAARDLTRAGERGVAVAAALQSGRAAAGGGGRVDLDALGDAAGQAEGLVAELDRVRGELARVRGGPLALGAGDAKRWALGRLDAAAARAASLAPTLEALPAALGADRPRTYLVVLTSAPGPTPGAGGPQGTSGPAPGAGEPLAVVELTFADGALTLGGPPGGELPAGARLDLPTTGPALLDAYRAGGRPRPDGVIAVDAAAVPAVLEATGPVVVPGFGRLEPASAVRQLTHDAAARWRDPAERRGHQQAALAAVLERFLGGGDLVASGRVLAAAGAAGTLQAYMADPAFQRLLARHRLDGAS